MLKGHSSLMSEKLAIKNFRTLTLQGLSSHSFTSFSQSLPLSAGSPLGLVLHSQRYPSISFIQVDPPRQGFEEQWSNWSQRDPLKKINY